MKSQKINESMEHGPDKFEELMKELLKICEYDGNEFYFAVLIDGIKEEYNYLLERLQHSDKERFNDRT